MSVNCKFCQKTFETASVLEEHKKSCVYLFNRQQCEHCQQPVSALVNSYHHGNNCDEKLVSCEFCSSSLKNMDMIEHLCVCEELTLLLFKKYNSKIEASRIEPMKTVLGHIKMTAKADILEGTTYRCVTAQLMYKEYIDFNIRVFYCAKQLNCSMFNLKRYTSWYEEAAIIYDTFPPVLFQDLKFLANEHLTPDILKEFEKRKRFTSWFYLETLWNDIKITDIVADDIGFQFVSGNISGDKKAITNKLIDKLVYFLHEYLNIYVSRMIGEYIIDEDIIKN